MPKYVAGTNDEQLHWDHLNDDERRLYDGMTHDEKAGYDRYVQQCWDEDSEAYFTKGTRNPATVAHWWGPPKKLSAWLEEHHRLNELQSDVWTPSEEEPVQVERRPWLHSFLNGLGVGLIIGSAILALLWNLR